MNLYALLEGLVSNEGRNKLMRKYYHQGQGEMSPSEFERLCESINKNEKSGLRVITKENGVYFEEDYEVKVLTSACLGIIGKSMEMEEREISQKIAEINSSKNRWFYFTKPQQERTPLDEILAELETSARYDEAAEILLKRGEIERAKLYQAAKVLVEQVQIPWYVD